MRQLSLASSRNEEGRLENGFPWMRIGAIKHKLPIHDYDKGQCPSKRQCRTGRFDTPSDLWSASEPSTSSPMPSFLHGFNQSRNRHMDVAMSPNTTMQSIEIPETPKARTADSRNRRKARHHHRVLNDASDRREQQVLLASRANDNSRSDHSSTNVDNSIPQSRNHSHLEKPDEQEEAGNNEGHGTQREPSSNHADRGQEAEHEHTASDEDHGAQQERNTLISTRAIVTRHII